MLELFGYAQLKLAVLVILKSFYQETYRVTPLGSDCEVERGAAMTDGPISLNLCRSLDFCLRDQLYRAETRAETLAKTHAKNTCKKLMQRIFRCPKL